MNKEFVWTDELLKQFADRANYCGYHRREYFHEKELSDFKASHTPEVKRDWEIAKFSHGINYFSHIGNDAYVCIDKLHGTTGDYLLSHNATIHSVRRLSDNSVWTVGDDCFHGPIVRFNLRDNQITADFEYGDVGCSKLLSELSKPLQRTPDSIKPPIGIMPEYIWKEQRLYELNQAIIRYINAGLSYPKEWGFERENLINETKPKH